MAFFLQRVSFLTRLTVSQNSLAFYHLMVGTTELYLIFFLFLFYLYISTIPFAQWTVCSLHSLVSSPIWWHRVFNFYKILNAKCFVCWQKHIGVVFFLSLMCIYYIDLCIWNYACWTWDSHLVMVYDYFYVLLDLVW